MKKVSMCVALLAALFVGCSSDEEGTAQSRPQEIKVGATVSGAITKAPVVTGDQFTAAITAFEGSAYPTWTSQPAWQNTITLTASQTNTGNWLPLDNSKVYPNSGNVYMAAWHPNIASVNGVVEFKKTGTEDVMYGGIVYGSKQSPVSSPFTFGHKLTQLTFRVQATDEFLRYNTGKAISKIEIVDGQYPASMMIADGKVTYADKSLKPQVPGIAQYVLTTQMEALGEPLMIGPMNALKIKVYYTDGTSSNEVTINNVSDSKTPLDIKEGYAHSVFLKFQGRDEVMIMATGSVSEWKTGESGNGTVMN